MNKLRTGIYPILVFFFISIIIQTISRAILVYMHQDDVIDNLLHVFGYGLRYDISINCSIFAPVFLFCVFCNLFSKTPKFFQVLQRVYISLAVSLVTLLEVVTPPFIAEYGIRPNHIFVEYLIYPNEVISTIYNGHGLEAIICICSTIFTFSLMYALSKFLYKDYKNLPKSVTSMVFASVLILIPMGIRGTVSHKPLNPSNGSFCSNPLANTIPVNSAFNVFYAFRHMGNNDVKKSQIFAFDEIANIFHNLPYLSKRTIPSTFDSQCAINQTISPEVTGKKRNVVVILEESFGSRYVKSLGGIDVAPTHDRLKEKSWWFNHMFATGHRSVRGIEAVTASYPPGPLSSQVKLDHPKPITTLPLIFKKLGYTTSFIYGGESHFDNMRSYFLNNGVDYVIEQRDYKDPEFVASWGVSDEDLYKKANEEFVKLSAENKPFCSVVFTSSFHDPFDIPRGKVDISNIKTDDPNRLKAAKYADYALGRFFDIAEKEDYYKNTIFVVIADHDSRVRGLEGFPLKNFRIPALIISPDVQPHEDNRIVSQIDILPTILSLAGVSGQFPIVGQDLTKPDTIDRAIMAYNEIFAYLNGNEFTLLAPNIKIKATADENANLFIKDINPQDVSKEVSYLNLGIAIYQYDFAKEECIKDLRQD